MPTIGSSLGLRTENVVECVRCGPELAAEEFVQALEAGVLRFERQFGIFQRI